MAAFRPGPGPGHPGSDPEVQRRQLAAVGVETGRIYAYVAVSGATSSSSRAQWHLLDQQLAQGDVLVVAAVDRLGRRYLETMWAIYDLQRHRLRLRSFAVNEGGVDQVPGRRSRLPGQHPGQYGGLRGQPGAPEHQPQDQGEVGRR